MGVVVDACSVYKLFDKLPVHQEAVQGEAFQRAGDALAVEGAEQAHGVAGRAEGNSVLLNDRHLGPGLGQKIGGGAADGAAPHDYDVGAFHVKTSGYDG